MASSSCKAETVTLWDVSQSEPVKINSRSWTLMSGSPLWLMAMVTSWVGWEVKTTW